MDLVRNIEDFDLVFLDLETTGLDVVIGDSICEIGAYKVKERKVIDKFHSLINPRKNVPKEAYNIHKISDQELENAPYFEEVSERFVRFLDNCVICAYNVGFDMGFIGYYLKKMDQPPLNLPAIDILSMARDAFKLSRYNLETVARSLNIDCSGGLHRALDDALITYKIFFKLLDLFKEKEIVNLKEFISLYGFSNEIFKSEEDQKALLLKQAIDAKSAIEMRYFSPAKGIEETKIMPLRVFREKRNFYLLCQEIDKESFRIKLNYIFNIRR